MGYEELVRRTVQEIQRRLDDPPDFRTLAASAFVSPYHFHRIFCAMVGELLRLVHAAIVKRRRAGSYRFPATRRPDGPVMLSEVGAWMDA